MVSDDGTNLNGPCFSAELPNVKRAEEDRFQATK
jgi:hypothetical protein